ncbi:MAG: penicillin-binding protein 2 [Chloroflexi bacterium]|nr:penicillin-binding protein 2 [Chloroflexota bacterium]
MPYYHPRGRQSPWPLLLVLVLMGALVGGAIYLLRGQPVLMGALGLSPRLAALRAVPTASATPADPDGGAFATPTPAAANPIATALNRVIPPTATPTPASPVGIAEAYLRAWQQRRYADLYNLLSAEAQRTISRDQFIERYQNITEMATIQTLDARLLNINPQDYHQGVVELPFRVEVKTRRVGDIVEENYLPLTYENTAWRVQWSPSLIFKDLTADYLIRLFPLNPQRGSIFDRKGRPLATQGFLVSVGVVPAEVKDERQMFGALAPYVKLKPEEIKERTGRVPADWYVPLAEFPAEREAELKVKLESVPGLVVRRKAARIYPNGEVASHLVGYTSVITAEEMDRLAAKGYEADDRLGRTGVEGWAEGELAGVRGGKLAVVTRRGEVVKIIKDNPARQGRNLYLSIDLEAQKKAEQVLGDKTGSIVVLDPRDNSVLAMASFPRYDPNRFVLGFSPAEWKQLTEDKRHPFQNRPVGSAYPTGSIFKVITMAAGIERGGFQPDSPFDCNGIWYGLGPGIPFRDWKPEGHGRVTLQRGITTSCNIVFYEIGKKLQSIDPRILPEYARRFGLGRPTGLIGQDEESGGTLPDPDWKQRTLDQAWFPGDSVNLAIGQGFLEATPLQMANVYSTLASNGTLRPPVLVQRITEADGQVVKSFEATPARPLGLSPTYLASVREGMIGVAHATDGTAYYAFQGYRTVTAAKTGSAENQGPSSHAWFAGYAPANNPQVVVLVMVEGSGAGSEIAAPRGRQMFEFFFPNPKP